MNSVKTVTADLGYDLRQQILSRFPARHENVWCHHVTAAYRDIAAVLGYGTMTANVMGMVSNERVQVLVLRVDGDDYRPDGKPWHLTISTADGVPPKEGGYVSLDDAFEVGDFRFAVSFVTRAAKNDEPSRKALDRDDLYAV